MKLTEFNAANCSTGRPRTDEPAIGITVTNGQIRFNKPALRLLGLSLKDQVQFLQDDNSGDWYVEIVKADGFVTRASKASGIYVLSTYVSKQLAEAYEHEGTGMRFLIESEPTKFEGRKLFGLSKL